MNNVQKYPPPGGELELFSVFVDITWCRLEIMSKEEDTNEGPKVNPYKMGTYDIVRMRINKLMEKPDVPVVIPESSRKKEPKAPPEFVRNVWGSAAGVGSGDFHIYRGIRRREYARLEFIEQEAKEAKNRALEEKRAKKRSKRQKRKEAMKRKRKEDGKRKDSDDSSDDSDQEVETKSSYVEPVLEKTQGEQGDVNTDKDK
nr:PRKR interacting protein 1 [Hymenolepis microstoma]